MCITDMRDEQWEMEEREKLKSDYEYKIATMNDRIRELERENEDAREHLKVCLDCC